MKNSWGFTDATPCDGIFESCPVWTPTPHRGHRVLGRLRSAVSRRVVSPLTSLTNCHVFIHGLSLQRDRHVGLVGCAHVMLALGHTLRSPSVSLTLMLSGVGEYVVSPPTSTT